MVVKSFSTEGSIGDEIGKESALCTQPVVLGVAQVTQLLMEAWQWATYFIYLCKFMLEFKQGEKGSRLNLSC